MGKRTPPLCKYCQTQRDQAGAVPFEWIPCRYCREHGREAAQQFNNQGQGDLLARIPQE